MKNQTLVYILLLAVVGGGVLLYQNQSKGKMVVEEEKMMTEVVVEEDKMMEDDSAMMTDDQMMMADENGYVEYSPESFEAVKDKKRVLFFYASWCPTCRPVDKELSEETGTLPDDVVVFKVNYDTETELKDKYGITYQHTFVLVDENGEEVSKWNGGDLEEIVSKAK